MTKEEVLKAAIKKAILNGWKFGNYNDSEETDVLPIYQDDFTDAFLIKNKYSNYHFTTREIIFSHDFAKAFWGEEEIEDGTWCRRCGYSKENTLPAWKYHLQRMVLCEEPLKYLEKFL